MGCCRSSSTGSRPRIRPRTMAICSNCHKSLIKKVQEEIDRYARNHAKSGTYSITVEVHCDSCRYVNRISTAYTRK